MKHYHKMVAAITTTVRIDGQWLWPLTLRGGSTLQWKVGVV